MSGYGRFAMYYDRLTGDVPYRSAAAFFDGVIREILPEAGLLLDLACGTGSLSLELSKLGYDIIGVDASEDMLAAAMQKTPEFPSPVMFLNQRAEDLDLYGTVDVCVCSLDSLNHLPNEAALDKSIQRVSLFLNPNGIFLFDINTLYKHRHVLSDNDFIYEYENFLCLWRNSLNDDDSIDISLDFFEKTGNNTYKRYSESFSERYYDPELIKSLLKKHSLELLHIYDGDNYSAPIETSQRLLYVAKKI